MKNFINQWMQWLKNQPIKQQRRLLLGCLIIGTLLLLLIVLLFSKAPTAYPSLHTHKLKTAVQTLDPKEVWIHHIEHAATQSNKRIADLEKQLKQLLKEKEAKSKKNISNKILTPKASKKESPATQLREMLGQQFSKTPPDSTHNVQPIPIPEKATIPLEKVLPLPTTQLSHSITLTPTLNTKKMMATGITQIKMPSATMTKPFQKTTQNTLLANTFAPAVLLGSVDALTNLNAASDPKPVLLQITGDGQLPRGGQQDLEGCHVSARAYGELPTERVEMRLETLTCRHRKTAAGMEMAVKGYVSGEDGRPGLRGIVVDRAGTAIRQVGLAGMMSSLSQFFIRKGTHLPTDTPTFNWQQAEGLLKAGAGQGVGNAFEKLAEFFIKRAERLEPIIQIQAGRQVTVVFTQGLPFEDQANGPSMPPITQKNATFSPFPKEAI
jgi:conjugal transfer pilus assembly protein TraB